ncbi:MAG: AMP-binding protein [Steroidobacteraceae bacterium]|jgi:acrylyl-CoA reductase (NADPH)/3-hydroxypropionyl-CoA dehydratase/3-hydroxypropionyl-CoA synthetase|nr:AMP-binding protein [Steroidobacteraceae bacterium]
MSTSSATSRPAAGESVAVTPGPALANPLRTRAAWDSAREACRGDPGAYHGAIAKREIHWFDASLGAQGAWIRYDDAARAWTGFDAASGAAVRAPYAEPHEPWARAFDDSEAPFYRWFGGGLTNACFNEIDRHVLAGHGEEAAIIFEGDRWDQSLDGGRGGPVVSYAISRKRLLLETAKCALALRQLGLAAGDRVAINMPNIPEQVFWTEACKRLGIVYTPVFGGFSDKTLSDRIHDAGARIVITADGGLRNAQVVPFKEVYTDPALDGYVPAEVAVARVAAALEDLAREGLELPAGAANDILAAARKAVAGEITLDRSDVMRGIGGALEAIPGLPPADASRIRTAIASALVTTPPRVEAVVVVRHTGQADLSWRVERDRWAHELTDAALAEIHARARAAGARLPEADSATARALADDLLALPDAEFVAAVWASCPPVPLDAEFPLFFIYTSGSTGKPKGVVHVHGGYVAGVAHSMKVAFDAMAGDVIYVVADPGWITGQSYMICGALAARVTTVIAEGAPVFPSAGRFASIIERYGVKIFKAGVTFLKTVMTDPQNVADVREYSMASLRVATFCAEPTSPAVQHFGMELVTPWYINSYWATEHGGIVWTHFFGNGDFPLRADAHTYPLPWVLGEVWVPDSEPDASGRVVPRVAAVGEKGEIVIESPYPYLCRTIWGDAASFRVDGSRVAAGWKGDFERYAKTYWTRWEGRLAYTQGDFAVKYDDGGYSLHGRSDDVINVSGHRLGTEEIEGAILRDKQLYPDSPVGNVVVVGAPHAQKGLTPLAFVKPAPGRRLTSDDRRRLIELVRQEKGATAVPEDFIEVAQFPETRSGKYMRRMVRALVEGADVGDTSTLRNPESIPQLEKAIAEWLARQKVADEQRIFEDYRYFRIQYHALAPGQRVALVTVSNPPVNALNERSLDELNIVVDHLARREDVKAVVFTGAGSASFVAGADIRQLLEDVHSLDEALPLPNNAHLAFRKIEAMDKPAIAAINGVALGGGMEFAMACHLRLAEPTATFGQPEVRLNLLPGYGGTQRLPRLLAAAGHSQPLVRALEFVLGGRTYTADEVQADGLLHGVATDAEDVVSLALRLAADYVRHPKGDGVVAQGFAARRALAAAWRGPGEGAFEAALADPEAKRLLAQAEQVGRAATAARILDALRTGWTQGVAAGLEREARLFAEAIVDPDGGKAGIQAFFDKRSAPLPTRRREALAPAALEAKGELLPVGAPFWPGFTPIPKWQYGHAVVRHPATGAPDHGLPKDVEREIVVPVDEPGPNEALVYVLTSEVNFNDIWAITGIPVSPFDNHDLDWQVTGSGGAGLVAALGSELKREGRLRLGDLVTIYSGQSDLLSPYAGQDPMYAGFNIQGYQTDTGSHQQFLRVQGPQLHPLPPDLTLEQAGSYVLNLGTITRALFTTLAIEPRRTIFVEGAATGTGLEALKGAAKSGLAAVGLVSSPARAEFVKTQGAVGAIDRKDPRWAKAFTPVPAGPEAIAAWVKAGEPILEAFRAQAGGRLADYAVSHAGQESFPRSFQLLAEGGALTFYGATSGYWFSFVGKPGSASPEEMLRRARLTGGEAVLLYYGVGEAGRGGGAGGLLDPVGLEAIEAVRAMGARLVVATATDAQREFVQSLGFGDAVRGVVSLEDLKRREGADFEWPDALPAMPDAKSETEAFKEAVRRYQDRTMKPFGGAIGRYLRSADNPRGYPDLVIERAGHDALAASTSLVKPHTGRVVYCEDLEGRRYTFYAPQVWMRQRRILMPTATIKGTHLCNAFEVTRMNDMIAAGQLEVSPPTVVPWKELPAAHQSMWDNTHAGANYVLNHALPRTGLKSRDELFQEWAARSDGEGTP